MKKGRKDQPSKNQLARRLRAVEQELSTTKQELSSVRVGWGKSNYDMNYWKTAAKELAAENHKLEDRFRAMFEESISVVCSREAFSIEDEMKRSPEVYKVSGGFRVVINVESTRRWVRCEAPAAKYKTELVRSLLKSVEKVAMEKLMMETY